MSEIKVSIIVPVFNVKMYLNQCLDSLINQTLKDIEIICINDGSTDNSLLTLKDYARCDNRITVIDKQNEGQSVARNIGINMAEGEYIGFVDSDDWVDNDYFEKLYDAAARNNCDIASAGFKRCRRHRTSIKKSYEAELVCTTAQDKIRLDNLPSDNYIWNKIYKRTVWNDLNFNFEPDRFFEDIAMTIKILHQMGKMVTVPDTYYNYRVNPASTIHTTSVKHKKDYLWAINEQKSYAEENNILLDFNKILMQKIYYKFIGITIIKIYQYENLSKYKLFGFLTIATKKTV